MINNQLFANKLAKRGFMAILAVTLIALFFVALEKTVEANVGNPFHAENHVGKYVDMGGRKWIVLDVVDGKPFLMMDSIYSKRAWNSSGDNSDASEILQYLQNEFNNIITVAEDRDLIAETVWEILSMDRNLSRLYTDVQGKTISPSSVKQKLAILSKEDYNCITVREVLSSDSIWMLTPYRDSSSSAVSTWLTPFPGDEKGICAFHPDNVTASKGIQPVLYLKDSARIRGGSGTRENPYVLSVSATPVAANIEADGTTNTVTVKNAPAGATVKVYDSNGMMQIGSRTNGSSPGTVVVAINRDLRWNEKVYVSFSEPGKAESGKVEATVRDNEPPNIDLNASSTPTNESVTVTVTITDGGSDVVDRKWAQGNQGVDYFRAEQGTDILDASFTVTENGDYTVYAKDKAGNDGVKQITIDSIDKTPPSLSDVSITSSNNAATWAKVGDEIELTFVASKALGTKPEVTISGNVATVEQIGDLTYRATYVMRNTDPEGTVMFLIEYQDKAGNTGTPVSSASDHSQVRFDRTEPTIQFLQNGNTDASKTAQSIVIVTDIISGVDSSALQFVWTNSESKPTTDWQAFGNGSELTLEDPAANGEWYLHVRAQDQAGNENYAVSNAFVLDNIAPVITLNGESELTIEAGSSFTDPGATATDNVDGDLTDSINITGTVNNRLVGAYTLFYDVSDAAGNTAPTVTRAVYVQPSEAPVIQFDPNGVARPAKTAASTVTVQDEGSGVDKSTLAYVWSDSPSEPRSGWQSFSNGEELKLQESSVSGNWYLHVRAKDQAGSESYAVSNAFVLDNTAPVISLIGSSPLYVPHGDDYVEPGAIATDNIDGDLSSSIEISGTVNTQTMGSYKRHYSASDRAGNSATVTRSVYVYDGSAPVIYLQGANPMFVEAGGTFADPGATAIDKQDGDLTASIVVNGTVDPMTIGAYSLSYDVSDSAGNQAPTVTRAVYVQDTEPPVLTLFGETEITLSYGAVFQDPGAKAIDAYYGDVSHLIEVIGSVDTTKAGTYHLRYHVQDPSGNSAEEQIRIAHVLKKRSSSSSGSSSSGRDEIEPTEPNELELFIDANGSFINVLEIDVSQSLMIIEVRPEDMNTADGSRVVYVNAPVSVLTELAKENPRLHIEIKTTYGSYLLPVTLPTLISGWEELLRENDWRADQINFKLTMTDITRNETIQKALAERLPSGQLIGSIVDFDLALVDAATGDVLTKINEFTQPIVRLIPLTEEQDPRSNLWGAFRYEPTSDEFTFVPATLEKRGDQWFAAIRSYSNSIYLIVENDVSFVDTERHWGKATVAKAAAKGLVYGRGEGVFDPDRSVSRAEFAAMLVRALGRSGNSLQDTSFADVQPGAWYVSEVAQAEKIGLLDFITNNRMMPNQPLAREEMARMLAVAIRLESQALPDNLASLDGYTDKADMDEAFLEDIQLIVTLDIMKGMGDGQFSPNEETTRAQATVVLLKTLEALGWID